MRTGCGSRRAARARRRSASTSRRRPAAASTAKASTSAAASPPTSRIRRAAARAAVPRRDHLVDRSHDAEGRVAVLEADLAGAIRAMTRAMFQTCSERGCSATAHE